jgi:hypothetical protein
MRNAYKILIGKSDGKRPHVRPRRRWEDNIKTNLDKIMCEGVVEFIWLRIWASGWLL